MPQASKNEPSEADKLAALRAYERARVARRRALHGDTRPADVEEVALALSGGGIRSATFSLGLMREMSRQRLLPKIDYLSTVSGGSYIGSFIGGLYARRGGKPGLLVGGADDGADPLGGDKVRKSLNWLRESGNYLAPTGAGDFLYALTLLVRNWLGVQLVIGAALFFVALVAVALRLVVGQSLLDPAFVTGSGVALLLDAHWLSPFVELAAVPAFGGVVFSWAYWLTRREAMSRWSMPWPALGGTALVVWVAFQVWHRPESQPWPAALVGVAGVLAFTVWVIAT
jgi:hypothetical protein